MFEFFLGFHATVDRIFSIYVALLSDPKVSSRGEGIISFPRILSFTRRRHPTIANSVISSRLSYFNRFNSSLFIPTSFSEFDQGTFQNNSNPDLMSPYFFLLRTRMPERVFRKIMLSKNNAPLSMTASAVFWFCFLFLFRFTLFFLFRYCKELFPKSVSEKLRFVTERVFHF